jgi:hypothetical protein
LQWRYFQVLESKNPKGPYKIARNNNENTANGRTSKVLRKRVQCTKYIIELTHVEG